MYVSWRLNDSGDKDRTQVCHIAALIFFCLKKSGPKAGEGDERFASLLSISRFTTCSLFAEAKERLYWGLPGGFEGCIPRNPQPTPSQPPANPLPTPSQVRRSEE